MKITGVNITQQNLTKEMVAGIAKKYGIEATCGQRELHDFSTTTGKVVRDIVYYIFDRNSNVVLNKTFSLN